MNGLGHYHEFGANFLVYLKICYVIWVLAAWIMDPYPPD